MADRLVAGENIQAGQCVRVGPDGKVYPSAVPTRSWLVMDPIPRGEAAVVGLTYDTVRRVSPGSPLPAAPWLLIAGRATRDIAAGERLPPAPGVPFLPEGFDFDAESPAGPDTRGHVPGSWRDRPSML